MLTKYVIIAFILIELSNIFVLYFNPGSRKANAVGVFSAWEQSKDIPEIHNFVKYLVYWVAGVKLILLMLLGVILIYGDASLQRISLMVVAIATMVFFWRMFPLIRKMDQNGQIHPKNYSVYLGIMIFAIILFFVIAAIVN